MKSAESKTIIHLCWPILMALYNHKQLLIRLQEIGFESTAPNLTNIKKAVIEGNPERKISLSQDFLERHAFAFIKVIESDGKLSFDHQKKEFTKVEGVEDSSTGQGFKYKQANGIIVHEEGRRSTSEKIQFIKNAKQEIIEVGIRLHTFSQYFTSRREAEFKEHVEKLLKKGVNMKCLMMDPSSEMTRLYMMDRAKALPSEALAFEQMPLILEDLKITRDELNNLGYSGHFELLTYNNFPYNHYMAVDPELESGKILISSYIHGVRRAHCPVMEIRKNSASVTFAKYYESLKLILEHAEPV